MFHIEHKKFEQDQFKYELKNIIQNESVKCYCEFEKVFHYIVNKWTCPFKRKFLRAIYALCMTKRLRKAIMKRSELKSLYNVHKQRSIKSYKKP